MNRRLVSASESSVQQSASFANYKEQVQLRQVLNELDKGRSATENQFNVDQKVVYRRFNRKLATTKLNIAKTVNDKQAIEDYRMRLFGKSFNSTINRDQEEDDLKRLLQMHRQKRPVSAASSSATSLERDKQMLLSSRSRNRRKQHKALITEKTNSSGLRLDDKIDMVVEANSLPLLNKRKQSLTKNDKKKRQVQVNFFSDSMQTFSPKMSKLEVHEGLVTFLKQEERVRSFCDQLEGLKLSQNSAAADYYSRRLGTTPRAPENSIADMREFLTRSESNMRNMTFKPVRVPTAETSHRDSGSISSN